MDPVTRIVGRAAPLDKADVDTDVIIPGEYLKRAERTGWGEFAFASWRHDPDFVLNDPNYQGAPILLAGPNFGCGSSREHAPWALQGMGFRAIIASSFGDIFRSNSSKVGLLTVVLPKNDVDYLMGEAGKASPVELAVDLESQTVRMVGRDWVRSFEVDPFVKECLLEGLDDITLTLREEAAIRRFEATRSDLLPRTIG